MAHPIPSKPPARPITPTGTPPADHPSHAVESRLTQLLAHFDAGTHSIDRADRETPEERRMSFGPDTLPTPPPSRRPSILSSLGILPFSSLSPSPSVPSTPASSSRRESFNHGLGFGMTPASSSAVVDEHDDARAAGHAKKRSLSMLDRTFPSGRDVHHLPPTSAHPELAVAQQPQTQAPALAPTSGPGAGGGITRPKSTPHLPRSKQAGFEPAPPGEALGVQANVAGQGPPATTGGRRASESGKRHFDPSRDPRLLGLI
ncbi:hypothetical protein IAR50_001070 [Cryptococcus sp. DSM 104548]